MDEPTDAIWHATVDGNTWLAVVSGMETNAYRGVLTVMRVSDDKEILREEVGLSFGAQFGPDQDDVNLWGQMVLESINHYVAQHPEEET